MASDNDESMIFLEKLKAKRWGVRLQNLARMSLESELVLEEFSRLGNALVKVPANTKKLKIGAYSYVREGSEIYFLESIGRFCSIGRGVVLGQAPDNHPINWVSTSMVVSKDYCASNGFSTIGHDVWIAHDAVVMAGVNIATGAVIGRNAVVTKDVGPYEIVVGNPARVVRTRFEPKQIEALLASRWWELPMQELGELPFDDVDSFLAALPLERMLAVYRSVAVARRRVTLLQSQG